MPWLPAWCARALLHLERRRRVEEEEEEEEVVESNINDTLVTTVYGNPRLNS